MKKKKIRTLEEIMGQQVIGNRHFLLWFNGDWFLCQIEKSTVTGTSERAALTAPVDAIIEQPALLVA